VANKNQENLVLVQASNSFKMVKFLLILRWQSLITLLNIKDIKKGSAPHGFNSSFKTKLMIQSLYGLNKDHFNFH